MGGLFKHKSSKETKTTDSSSQNLLAQNKDFMNTFNQANSEMANAKWQDYQVAGFSDEYQQAQANLLKGIDQSDLKAAQDYMTGIGQSQLTQGLAGQAQAQSRLTSFANMTQADFQKGYQSEYNGDLVNQQIAGLTKDVTKWTDQQIMQLNQNATASGTMGSSRAGVAQGVIAGEAADKIATGSLNYRTQEEQLAQSRYMNYLNTQMSGVQSLANFSQNQISFGNQAYAQGIGYGQQRNANILQNWQNAYNVGAQQQQWQQYQLDINRQNSMMSSSPALARLSMYGGILQPFANNGTVGHSVETTVKPASNGLMGGLMGAAGAIGGAYLGSFIGDPALGAQLGAGIGGSMGKSM
ncbi:hypothetical protein OXE08_004519 [Salmonella enterica]|nr:hypothetical protein [Salmonella enterica]